MVLALFCLLFVRTKSRRPSGARSPGTRNTIRGSLPPRRGGNINFSIKIVLFYEKSAKIRDKRGHFLIKESHYRNYFGKTAEFSKDPRNFQ